MFTIGEFSVITRLPVKTLRFYHEEGILIPDWIDDESGYRYYRETSVEKASLITMLRGLDFPLSEIREMLFSSGEDANCIAILEKRRSAAAEKAKQFTAAENSLSELIAQIRRTEMNTKNNNFDVCEKVIEDIIFAGIRFSGRYDTVGKYFKAVGKSAGRFISGTPISLFYDGEYRETADIEPGFPLSKSIHDEGISCRVLKGGRALTLVHKGPYETIGTSYEKLYIALKARGLNASVPTREVYIKGPGMILRGKPENYLTEIQVFVES